jgi:biopolymer transport protein ExbD
MALSHALEYPRWSPSKAAALRAAKRKSQFYCGIELSGLLSVELVLLVIFMTAPPSYHHPSVDLPRVSRFSLLPGANRDDAIRVLVSRDGRVYLNLLPIASSDFHEQLRAAVKNGSEAKVYLSADGRARNVDVESVIDEIQLAGIRDVAIVVSSPTGKPIAPAPKIPITAPFYFLDTREIPVRRLTRQPSSTLQIRKSTDPAP